MPMDMPPVTPPAHVAPAPVCNILTPAQAQVAFQNLRKALPGTAWAGARPSQICGLVRVEMESGKVAYTDVTGRFMLLAFALDTKSGGPADVAAELNQALIERETFPSEPIPNVHRSVE